MEKEKKEKEEKEKKDKEKKGDLLADIVLPINEFGDKDEDKNEDEANAARTRWRCGPLRAAPSDSAPGGPSDSALSDSAPSDSVNVANEDPWMDILMS